MAGAKKTYEDLLNEIREIKEKKIRPLNQKCNDLLDELENFGETKEDRQKALEILKNYEELVKQLELSRKEYEDKLKELEQRKDEFAGFISPEKQEEEINELKKKHDQELNELNQQLQGLQEALKTANKSRGALKGWNTRFTTIERPKFLQEIENLNKLLNSEREGRDNSEAERVAAERIIAQLRKELETAINLASEAEIDKKDALEQLNKASKDAEAFVKYYADAAMVDLENRIEELRNTLAYQEFVAAKNEHEVGKAAADTARERVEASVARRLEAESDKYARELRKRDIRADKLETDITDKNNKILELEGKQTELEDENSSLRASLSEEASRRIAAEGERDSVRKEKERIEGDAAQIIADAELRVKEAQDKESLLNEELQKASTELQQLKNNNPESNVKEIKRLEAYIQLITDEWEVALSDAYDASVALENKSKPSIDPKELEEAEEKARKAEENAERERNALTALANESSEALAQGLKGWIQNKLFEEFKVSTNKNGKVDHNEASTLWKNVIFAQDKDQPKKLSAKARNILRDISKQKLDIDGYDAIITKIADAYIDYTADLKKGGDAATKVIDEFEKLHLKTPEADKQKSAKMIVNSVLDSIVKSPKNLNKVLKIGSPIAVAIIAASIFLGAGYANAQNTVNSQGNVIVDLTEDLDEESQRTLTEKINAINSEVKGYNETIDRIKNQWNDYKDESENPEYAQYVAEEYNELVSAINLETLKESKGLKDLATIIEDYNVALNEKDIEEMRTQADALKSWAEVLASAESVATKEYGEMTRGLQELTNAVGSDVSGDKSAINSLFTSVNDKSASADILYNGKSSFGSVEASTFGNSAIEESYNQIKNIQDAVALIMADGGEYAQAIAKYDDAKTYTEKKAAADKIAEILTTVDGYEAAVSEEYDKLVDVYAELISEYNDFMNNPVILIDFDESQIGTAENKLMTSKLLKGKVLEVIHCKYEKATGNVSIIVECQKAGGKNYYNHIEFTMDKELKVVDQNALMDSLAETTSKVETFYDKEFATSIDNTSIKVTIDGVEIEGTPSFKYSVTRNYSDKSNITSFSAELIIIMEDANGNYLASETFKYESNKKGLLVFADVEQEIEAELMNKVNDELGLNVELKNNDESEVEAE